MCSAVNSVEELRLAPLAHVARPARRRLGPRPRRHPPSHPPPSSSSSLPGVGGRGGAASAGTSAHIPTMVKSGRHPYDPASMLVYRLRLIARTGTVVGPIPHNVETFVQDVLVSRAFYPTRPGCKGLLAKAAK